MTSVRLTDTELFSRIAEYDKTALAELYDRYNTIIYSLARKITGNEEAASDVLAGVMDIVWRKVTFFDLRSANTYTWLITLTRNLALDHLKRFGQNSETIDEYDDIYEDTFIVPHCIAQEDEPLDIGEALSMKPQVESAMNRLTDAQKFVISLAWYEGLSEKEIAQRMRIPAQTISSKIKTAVLNLNNNLKQPAK